MIPAAYAMIHAREKKILGCIFEWDVAAEVDCAHRTHTLRLGCEDAIVECKHSHAGHLIAVCECLCVRVHVRSRTQFSE
jgi:hypothetical protein